MEEKGGGRSDVAWPGGSGQQPRGICGDSLLFVPREYMARNAPCDNSWRNKINHHHRAWHGGKMLFENDVVFIKAPKAPAGAHEATPLREKPTRR